MTMYEKLNGKQLEVKYETGAHYRMTYLSENELKWEALSEVAEGEATTGTEPYWAYEVAEGIYHIDWIEQDGMTAAQTVNLNELVKQYLQKEGYEVRSYLTFDEAQLHTGDDDVHLWILDIMLGDKSGFDLIEEIRRVNPEVPVIFMSARDKEFDRIIGLEKGSDDYITKPFSPKELVLRVNNVIRRTYKDEETRLETDGYSIDESKRTVYDRDGNVIDLTTKEFELLIYHG